MSSVDRFALAARVDADSSCTDCHNYPRGGFEDEENNIDTFNILPSSDSIRSTTTNDTRSSWQSSSTTSTIVTYILSIVSKGVGSIWDRTGEVKEVVSTSGIKRSKQSPCDGSFIDLEAGLWLPLEPFGTASNLRVNSTLWGEEGTLVAEATIHVNFDFGDKTHTYDLEHTVFRKWKYMAMLLNALEVDGTACISIWDELEQMQVTAGDWDARARPGWTIRVFCEDINGDNWSNADQEDEMEVDETSRADGWWFKRWKSRVERNKEGRKKKRMPWLVGAVAMVAISVSFCTLVWFSFTEDRGVLG